MSRTLKVVVGFLAFDAVALGAWLGYRTFLAGPATPPQDAYEWTAMDAGYQPKSYVESFILNDALTQGLTPVYIRDYGQNAAVLRRFRGAKFARPKAAVLEFTYPGLEDWMLVDIRYANPEKREIRRTVLYVRLKGEWRVGDSGQLAG